MKVVEAPSISRQAGIFEIPPTKLPGTAKGITIAINRAELPAGPAAEIHLYGSEDGESYDYLGGCQLSGGSAKDNKGNELLESSYTVQFEAKDFKNSKIIEFPETYIVKGLVRQLQPFKAAVEIRTL